MPAPSVHHLGDLVDDQTAHDFVVVGVDTHKDIHVAVALTGAGIGLGTSSFPTTQAGYRNLLAWAQRSPRPWWLEWKAPGRGAPGLHASCGRKASRSSK
jgi:hypothetical protein